MKKNYKNILVVLFVIATILTTGCGNQNNNANNNSQQNILTETEARQYALQKAGLDTATFTKQEYDAYESEYEFEFHTENQEYDCDVNAIDGTIKNYSVENRELLD